MCISYGGLYGSVSLGCAAEIAHILYAQCDVFAHATAAMGRNDTLNNERHGHAGTVQKSGRSTTRNGI